MKTEDLIARLAADIVPVSCWARDAKLGAGLLTGLVVASILCGIALGIAPDATVADAGPTPWASFAFVALCAMLGYVLMRQLAMPDAKALSGLSLAPLPLAFVATQMADHWVEIRPAVRQPLFSGLALQVGLMILLLALPIYLSLVAALNRLAPTRPFAAGAAAGWTAASAAAAIYMLASGEGSSAISNAHYLGAMIAGAISGGVAGRRLLRW